MKSPFSFFILLSLSLISLHSYPQYLPTWESLDSRPVPQWFKDGKFGIFIHWGVYSVPGWSSKGNYAEWYQNGLMNGDTARINFHKKKFGNRTYYQLADDFKAELFNPDEWAKLFEQSGAKYIVLTSKHHDGFTLWPSKESNKDWGFEWNAFDVGPKRDLLGDLFKAIRKTSVHPGMYYSLYEWFNPLWKADKSKYATQHVWPQMKDLINTYHPDVFWTDGDWEASDDVWKSKEFLQWMYNESPVKDKVVTYDRWGSDVRFKHGAVFTPEYQPNADFEDHYFEESRGMGASYGYNRMEDAWDYNSPQSLIIALIDKVSRGGNFLLDIGPDEHGKIPPIMQERLLQIGEWLKINGEAIYGTSRWKVPSQGFEKRSNTTIKKEDEILLELNGPTAGYTTKDIFFTYNSLTNTLYAIFPKYPSGKKLVLKDISMPSGTRISLLSNNKDVSWKQDGQNVIVSLPDYDPNDFKSSYTYVIKISNFGAFAKKPKINVSYKDGPLINMIPVINMIKQDNATIRYTIDGTEPTENSLLYSKPFTLNKTAMVNAKSFENRKLSSGTASQSVKRYEWMNAVNPTNLKPGIEYRYSQPDSNIDLSSALIAPVAKTGVTDIISLKEKMRKDKLAFRFDGYIKVDKDDIYNFSTLSDDGSKLFIDNTEVVDNDGQHGSVEKSDRAALRKGFHKIRVLYFDSGGNNDLKVFIQPSGGIKIEISNIVLFH